MEIADFTLVVRVVSEASAQIMYGSGAAHHGFSDTSIISLAMLVLNSPKPLSAGWLTQSGCTICRCHDAQRHMLYIMTLIKPTTHCDCISRGTA